MTTVKIGDTLYIPVELFKCDDKKTMAQVKVEDLIKDEKKIMVDFNVLRRPVCIARHDRECVVACGVCDKMVLRKIDEVEDE